MQKLAGAAAAYSAYEASHKPAAPLTPALASIQDSCSYMGGVSRAKFYADILPQLETVKLGRRNFVVVSSMDRLIEASRRPAE
jgi:hypothetical protein